MKSTAEHPRVILLTGTRNVGKTTCILRLAAGLKDLGMSVFGVATPKIFDGDEFIGLAVKDLASGKQIQLARMDGEPGLRQGPWRFSPEGIRFANNVCDPRDHTGFAIIDEIGPLELRGEGFVTGFGSLKRGEYSQALAVVRPELADQVARFIKGEVMLINWEPDCFQVLMSVIDRVMMPISK